MKPLISPAMIFGLTLGLAPLSQAALNGFLTLTINGTQITGASRTISMGEDDVSSKIEVYSFSHEVYADPSDSRVPLTHGTIKIVKRIDKSSPLLAQGLDEDGEVNGVLQFYDRDPDAGSIRRSYNYSFTQGRVLSIRNWKPSTLDPSNGNIPDMEEIQIAYTLLTVTDDVDSTSFQYSSQR